MDRELRKRCHLPHREVPNGAVFLTWRLHRGQRPLAPEERDTVLAVLSFSSGTQCTMLAAVVMDDHVHALVRPTPPENARTLVQRWKSITSRRIVAASPREAPLWQAEYFDRWLGHPDQLSRCVRYVMDNPYRRWPALTEYRWILEGGSAP